MSSEKRKQRIELKFEDYFNYKGNEGNDILAKRASAYDKEVIRRCLGFSSPLLGAGKTKTNYLESALKLMVQVFIREPVEASLRPSTSSRNPKEQKKEETEEFHEAKESHEDLNEEGVEPEDNFTKVQGNAICRNWARGTCRKGSSCTFRHPELCQDFCRHGPRRNSNPKGCAGKCGLLHPKNKWCFAAVKTGNCMLGKYCKFEHYKGITYNKPKTTSNLQGRRGESAPGQRQPPPRSPTNQPGRNSYAPGRNSYAPGRNSYAQVTAQSQPFLEQVCLRMEQILARLDNLEKNQGGLQQPRASWPSYH